MPVGSGAGLGLSATKTARLPARLTRNDGDTGCVAPAICAPIPSFGCSLCRDCSVGRRAPRTPVVWPPSQATDGRLYGDRDSAPASRSMRAQYGAVPAGGDLQAGHSARPSAATPGVSALHSRATTMQSLGGSCHQVLAAAGGDRDGGPDGTANRASVSRPANHPRDRLARVAARRPTSRRSAPRCGPTSSRHGPAAW